METLVYKLGGVKRPGCSRYVRLLFKLHSLPLVHKFVHKRLQKALGLPDSVAFNQKFYCTSPLLEVAEHTGLGNLHIIAYAPVRIGHHCSFSFNNMIITSSHDYTNFGTVLARPVTIGDNVWVTSNVTILPGVTIGSNSVIGAGSVVTKDIPSGVFAAGNPCKVIKPIKFSIDGKLDMQESEDRLD